MGARIIPTTSSVGMTVRGTKRGCHARNRCCLKGVSDKICHGKRQNVMSASSQLAHKLARLHLLVGLRQLPFSFWVSSLVAPAAVVSVVFFRLVAMVICAGLLLGWRRR